MKNLILILLMIILPTSYAQTPQEDKFITYDPTWNLGIGLEFSTESSSATYATLVIKGYLLTMGFPKEIGMQVLGLGVAQSSRGATSLVISPMMYYIGPVGVGPELLIPSVKETNFGMTISYRF